MRCNLIKINQRAATLKNYNTHNLHVHHINHKQVTSFIITKQENQSTDYRSFFFSNGEITPVNVYPCSKALVDLFFPSDLIFIHVHVYARTLGFSIYYFHSICSTQDNLQNKKSHSPSDTYYHNFRDYYACVVLKKSTVFAHFFFSKIFVYSFCFYLTMLT